MLGTEDTAEFNSSSINAGAGNDLIVLHSNDASSNIIKIDGAFGKNTVVNFHNVATHLVDEPADVGAHEWHARIRPDGETGCPKQSAGRRYRDRAGRLR